jgi:hypothetical protein
MIGGWPAPRTLSIALQLAWWRDPKGLSETHIGEEYYLETSYRINRELEFGAGIGRIFPGAFLVSTNGNHAYTDL